MKIVKKEHVDLLINLLSKKLDDKYLDIIKEKNFSELDNESIKKILSILTNELSQNGFNKLTEDLNLNGKKIDSLITFFSNLSVSRSLN